MSTDENQLRPGRAILPLRNRCQVYKRDEGDNRTQQQQAKDEKQKKTSASRPKPVEFTDGKKCVEGK